MGLFGTILVSFLLCKGVLGVSFDTPDTDPDTATNDVAENAAAGFTAETLVATGGTLTYSIVSEDGSTTVADFHFEIANDDEVTLKSGVTLDYETKSEYVLVVKVDDSDDSSSATATLTVSITDANEAPVFGLAQAPACISSSSATGDAVGTWTANDPDTTAGAANGAVTGYAISAGDASSQFQVSTAGVVTRTAVDLDATVQKQYYLEYEADDGAATGTTTIVVYVDEDSYCGGNGSAGLFGSMMTFVSVLIYSLYQIL